MTDASNTEQAASSTKKGAAVTREEFEALKGHVEHLVKRLGAHGIHAEPPTPAPASTKKAANKSTPSK